MKNLRDIDVDNKKVLVRVDFNVPLTQDLEVKDDFRIRAHLETIKYLKEHNARIILISHLGSPKGKELNLSLKSVSEKLEEISSYKVKFVEETLGDKVKKAIDELDAGDILVLENLRFNSEEEENNQEFAASLARLADIFVQDAFSVCHRDHASISSIPKYLDSYPGFLLEKEISALDGINSNVKHPFVAIIGGAKIIAKTTIIKNFLDKADAVLLGGVIGNTVLKFKGLYGQEELKDRDVYQAIKDINFDDPKLVVPVDGVITKGSYSRVGSVDSIKNGEDISDIGPETINYYKEIIKRANTIIWNGPMGKIENEVFSKGTKAITEAIAEKEAYSVAGGGETVDYISDMKKEEGFTFISSGGGAMLDYISGKILPGIEALNKYYER